MITVKHSGNVGDLLYALPAIKQLAFLMDEKVTVLLKLNVEAHYSPGNDVHPVKDKDGKHVMLNANMFELVKPLLMAQDYIKTVKKWKEGDNVDVDLDLFRLPRQINTSAGHISRWYFYHHPQLSTDLSTASIQIQNIQEDLLDKIIISRSQRYHNANMDYSVLKPIEDKIMFIGVDEEYEEFKTKFGLNVERLIIKDFLHMAECIASCKFFIGNQSSPFAVAEQLKIPRIVEVYPIAPNVIPTGGLGFDAYATPNLVYHVNMLIHLSEQK
jgi:hypothetical protein